MLKVEVVKFMLIAQDMDRAITFYKDVVGLEVKVESADWSELVFGDAIVALHGGGNGEFNKTGLSIQVVDIDEACKEIEASGGRVLDGQSDRPGEPIKLASLADTEGNGFMLTQYIG